VPLCALTDAGWGRNHRIEKISGIALHVWKHMRVRVERHADIRMPQPLLNNLWMRLQTGRYSAQPQILAKEKVAGSSPVFRSNPFF